MLDTFEGIYERGTIDEAAAYHERIDALGLAAIDPNGNKYHVFNVYFVQGALLFAASRSHV